MHARMLAVGVLVPAAALVSAAPAVATPAAPARSNTVRVTYTGSTAPIHALRSSSLSCTGTPTSTKQATLAGKTVAELDMYTSSANGGTVWACLRHVGTTKGVRLPTTVEVTGAPTTTSNNAVTVVATGRYVSYAGPAGVAGLNGKYAVAAGTITIGCKKITIVMTPSKATTPPTVELMPRQG